MEIERKWLVEEVPDLRGVKGESICQAYISTAPVIRIRQQGKRYELTVKGSGLMAREEMNLPIDELAFLRLLTKAEGRIIKKTRYVLPLENGHVLAAWFGGSREHADDVGIYMAEKDERGFPSLG